MGRPQLHVIAGITPIVAVSTVIGIRYIVVSVNKHPNTPCKSFARKRFYLAPVPFIIPIIWEWAEKPANQISDIAANCIFSCIPFI